MSDALGRFVSGLVGAVLEAWSELRVHRGRVLLSLVGVGVAVAALTTVVAAGSIAEQSFRETAERAGGRAATLTVSTFRLDGQPVPADEVRTAFATAVERYGITYASERGFTQQDVRFPDGRSTVPVEVVDVAYAEMHRVPTIEGAWFTSADERRLAPALVVNQRFWERLGSPDLRTHPTVTLFAPDRLTAVVVGVTPSTSFETDPTAFMLASDVATILGPTAQDVYGTPQFEVWVPPAVSEELRARLAADIRGQLGTDVQVDVFRNDFGEQGADQLRLLQLIVAGIALVVLLLGALGLINIALVTVRTRIREIGIRRTFGATGGRVFFAVLMESVVATLAAGVVGVMLAVLVIRNPLTVQFIAQGVTDVPPFPVSAALVGLAAATGVGALAGLIPALVAVRVKVIDALRF